MNRRLNRLLIEHCYFLANANLGEPAKTLDLKNPTIRLENELGLRHFSVVNCYSSRVSLREKVEIEKLVSDVSVIVRQVITLVLRLISLIKIGYCRHD